jgi:hypothetical protein
VSRELTGPATLDGVADLTGHQSRPLSWFLSSDEASGLTGIAAPMTART